MTRSVRRAMCAAMLGLQAVVLFLAGLVMTGVTDLGFARSFGIGVALAVLCLLAAGLLRSPVGYALGWTVQGVSLLLGIVVPVMLFLGIVFTALWTAAYVVGAKIDREKAERAAVDQTPAGGDGVVTGEPTESP